MGKGDNKKKKNKKQEKAGERQEDGRKGQRRLEDVTRGAGTALKRTQPTGGVGAAFTAEVEPSPLTSSRKIRKKQHKLHTKEALTAPACLPPPLPEHAEDWFEAGKRRLMESTQRKRENTKEQLERARRKIHDLSTSSDTKGISFSGCALHWVYYETKFVRRGQLLYTLFATILQDPACAALCQAVCDPWMRPRRGVIKAVSIGGGPGTDAAGLAWLCRTLLPARKQGPTVLCHLMDNEKSWKRYETPLNAIFKPSLEASFLPGDVCSPLHHDNNKDVALIVPEADLLVFSYVCHETSARTAASGLAFYRDVAKAAKPGAAFVFLDVMRHSAKHLSQVATAMAEACDAITVMDTSLPSLNSLPTQLSVLSKRDA